MKQPEIRHYGIIRNGKKIYFNPDLYARQIGSLEGKEFEEVFKEKLVKPSKETHGYYRGGVISTCLVTEDFAGWTKDEVDDLFCDLFLKSKIDKELPGGERREIIQVGSTGDLNQKEMNYFIQQVTTWLSERGIEILKPEEYNLNKYRSIKP